MITRSRSLPSFRSSVSLLLIVLSLSLYACGSSGSAGMDPQAEYNAAVQDAKNMTPEKISKNLTALVPENMNLKWENGTPGGRVLVSTFVDSENACKGYMDPESEGCKAGSECAKYKFNSWVTVVPELKTLLGRNPTLLRVDQALGLPPPAGGQTLDNTCIVELYVDRKDLFRPSPDPEVTDQEAELHFPLEGFRTYDDTKLVYSDMPCDPARCPDCTSSGKCGMTTYRNWFDNRRAYVYSQTAVNGPFPWTALGYTYDWGNPVPPHFGVSEFVVNSGSNGVSVFIKSVTWTGAYFAQ